MFTVPLCCAEKRLMCSGQLPANEITSLQTYKCMHTEVKQTPRDQRQAPSPPLQFTSTERFMRTILFVCGAEEHKEYCMSGAIYQTLLQSVYWLSASIHCASRGIHGGRYRRLSEMRNIKQSLGRSGTFTTIPLGKYSLVVCCLQPAHQSQPAICHDWRLKTPYNTSYDQTK